MDKLVTLIVLPFVLVGLTIPRVQITNRPLDFSTTPAIGSSQVSEDFQLVSVAYDPLVMSYPDKDMSPYGPVVSPVYNLTKQALAYLNPQNPDNPLSNTIMPGDVVVLKPNLVSTSGFAKEGCTRTAILRPLVDLSVSAGASKVIIAEGPSSPDPLDIVFSPDYSNITGLVQALQEMYPSVNIGYENLNQDQFTWVDLAENSSFYGAYAADQLYSLRNMRMDMDSFYYAEDAKGYNPQGYRPGLYAVANTVFQADVFINVPKMKVHHLTGVTLSLKNLVGITVSSTGNTTHEESVKDIPHWNNTLDHSSEVLTRQDSFENDVLWRVMGDLNKIILYTDKEGVLKSVKQRKYLSVVDGVMGMEGPTVYNPPGVPRPTGSIIAGQDPVAVDSVCSRVMGFNFTILNSIVSMGQVSDPQFGTADPAAICVVGTALNNSTFWEPYVPHVNYEDSQIAPHKIRLQYFDQPEAQLIEIEPEPPREGIETKVVVYTPNIDLVAAGWLRYSIDGAESTIMKMVLGEENVTGSLGVQEAGANVSYDVCLQDFFFNTGWSDKMHTIVAIWGDVNADGDVDGFDLTYMCGAYGATPGHPKWDENCDFNLDDIIDGSDLTPACSNYGKTI